MSAPQGVPGVEYGIGDRVTLRPAHNWLRRFAPLAANGRVGTIIDLPHARTATVQFDTCKAGARPIVGIFFRGDLLRSRLPLRQQSDIFGDLQA